MTLQDLRYLVALADHGHFGRAAAACDIGQSTLSTQIRKLEESLGLVLFERTGKGVHIADPAIGILAGARRVLAETQALVATARRHAEPLSGALVLGIIPTLAPYLLPLVVPALRLAHPRLRLAIHEDVGDGLRDSLAAHRIDAALLSLPVADPALATLELFDEPFWFAAPHGHALAEAASVRAEDLRGRALLLLAEGHCLRDQVLAICGASTDAAGAAAAGFRATSLETIRQMVAAGLGCTLLPALALTGRDDDAVALRPLARPANRRIGLIWRRSFPRPEELHLLAGIMRARLPPGVRALGGTDPQQPPPGVNPAI
jgi:LysR family hydrogen peroxide-inducible transcriptional activator